MHSDELDIIDDSEHVAQEIASRKLSQQMPPWRIMIVDDDSEVHKATLFALQDIRIDDRQLHFIHAYTAEEALSTIRADQDIAVIILDVVMENESAGLDLVKKIRHDLERSALRIILRTGQPGYAPEMRVIREYDINDYKTKSELTRVRLLTTLTTAVRSYHQLQTILAAQGGLNKIAESAADLFTHRDLTTFAEAAMRGATALAGEGAEGFLCAHPNGFSKKKDEAIVIGATPYFASYLSHPVAECEEAAKLIAQAQTSQHLETCGQATAFLIPGDTGHQAFLYLKTPTPLRPADHQLLDVFCINIGVGLENVRLISDLSFSAYSDSLTRLSNRSGFIARIDERLCAGNSQSTMALVDIDHFSEFNDALGHHKGDELLLAVAQRLGTMISPQMLLARVGGDVFGIFGPDELLDPHILADQFKMPFAVGDYSLPIKATIGLTRADSLGKTDGLELLKATNIALNRAKQGGRGRWHYYTEDMAEATRKRLDLLHNLRLALIQQQGLEMHYQPQIELATGKVIGAEALIRWRGQDGQFIRPDQFISVAEYSGLIVDLGAWVFRTAIKEVKHWDTHGLGNLRMAINVSLVQFRDPLFLQRIRSALKELDVSPSRIELEITESVAMMEAETVISILGELKQMGIQIAIDDFGTGFSSLSYLHRLPIDQLKIDRAFVRDVTSAEGAGARIAQTVVRLGQSLGLSVIAEGIETEDQAQLLMDMGCPRAQGFLYSKPVNAEDFIAWCKLHA